MCRVHRKGVHRVMASDEGAPVNDDVSAPSEDKILLTELDPEEIAAKLKLKAFQGRQIFEWIHRKRVFDFDAMTNLSKDLRRVLGETCVGAQLRLAEAVECPKTGAKKALFALRDGNTIETVLLRDRDRITICLSSQVGCALGCTFCATGHSGFTRDLSAGEIVEQALHILVGEDLEGRTPNLVYMGMGEPFLNYEAVVRSMRLLMREDGLNVGARRITVSTVGVVPGIKRFAQEGWQVRLAISLHAANDALRLRLAPFNRRYRIADIMRAVREYVATTGRQVSFEWVLFKGVNDSQKDAQELADLIAGMKAIVNVIPYNAAFGAEFSAPTYAGAQAFCDGLTRRGVKATLRKERGQEIQAACGQLRSRHAGEGTVAGG